MNKQTRGWFGFGMVTACTLFVGMPMVANASTAAIDNAYVTRVLVDATSYGNCMAALSVNPNAVLSTCASSWVSFSCSGTYTTKDVAYRMLDQAQLALALNKTVYVRIDDTKKHNGYCFASRIDVK